ncbi:MAG: hypothetical protein NC191_09010 [Muribaculaceae bacterium]|nr:hypothetical protein [Muribaculaceae bacterium]
MDISHWNDREIVQVLIARGKLSQKSLVNKIKEKYGKDIPQPTFANKLLRNRLRVEELQQICDVLDYSIVLVKNNK